MSRTIRRKNSRYGGSYFLRWLTKVDEAHAEANSINYFCWGNFKKVIIEDYDTIRSRAKHYSDNGYSRTLGPYLKDWGQVRSDYRDKLKDAVKCSNVDEIELIDYVAWEDYHYHDYD